MRKGCAGFGCGVPKVKTGLELAEARRAAGVKQSEVAVKLSLHRSPLSAIERGDIEVGEAFSERYMEAVRAILAARQEEAR